MSTNEMNIRTALSRIAEGQNLSTDEIASLLGYTETPNFYRAFKRWTGQAPSAFKTRVEHPIRN